MCPFSSKSCDYQSERHCSKTVPVFTRHTCRPPGSPSPPGRWRWPPWRGSRSRSRWRRAPWKSRRQFWRSCFHGHFAVDLILQSRARSLLSIRALQCSGRYALRPTRMRRGTWQGLRLAEAVPSRLTHIGGSHILGHFGSPSFFSGDMAPARLIPGARPL